jgi:hypothetical protein
MMKDCEYHRTVPEYKTFENVEESLLTSVACQWWGLLAGTASQKNFRHRQAAKSLIWVAVLKIQNHRRWRSVWHYSIMRLKFLPMTMVNEWVILCHLSQRLNSLIEWRWGRYKHEGIILGAKKNIMFFFSVTMML